MLRVSHVPNRQMDSWEVMSCAGLQEVGGTAAINEAGIHCWVELPICIRLAALLIKNPPLSAVASTAAAHLGQQYNVPGIGPGLGLGVGLGGIGLGTTGGVGLAAGVGGGVGGIGGACLMHKQPHKYPELVLYP
jgi:hypothetical protein